MIEYNEGYLKIKQTAEEKVGSILSNGKALLRLALFVFNPYDYKRERGRGYILTPIRWKL
jgi:hypothetical protein